MARTFDELWSALEHDALDVYQPDVVLALGISGARTLADLVLRRNRWFTPHTWTNGIGLLANLHVCCGVGGGPLIEFPYDPPGWTPERRDFMLASPVTDRFRWMPGRARGPRAGDRARRGGGGPLCPLSALALRSSGSAAWARTCAGTCARRDTRCRRSTSTLVPSGARRRTEPAPPRRCPIAWRGPDVLVTSLPGPPQVDAVLERGARVAGARLAGDRDEHELARGGAPGPGRSLARGGSSSSTPRSPGRRSAPKRARWRSTSAAPAAAFSRARPVLEAIGRPRAYLPRRARTEAATRSSCC